MIRYRITPDKITTLFESKTLDLGDAKPGDYLLSYPDGPARGEEATGEESRAESSLIVLSDPVHLSQVSALTPCVIKDTSDRVLSVNGEGIDEWQWAFVGQYLSYPKDVMPLSFSTDPLKSPAMLTAHISDSKNWVLYANGQSSGVNTFWASSSYGNNNYPKLLLKARPLIANPKLCMFSWVVGSNVLNLSAESGAWNYVAVSAISQTEFSIHQFYVVRNRIAYRLKDTWPSSTFDLQTYKSADPYYEAITDAQARAIYANSGLSFYTYKPDVFDCDDFSFVYKGQASKNAFNNNAEYAYAVGLIYAISPSGGAHAANIFIDTKGDVKVLEPQRGTIVAGTDWKDNAGKPYQPYFILM